jgi:hypothetical protein
MPISSFNDVSDLVWIHDVLITSTTIDMSGQKNILRTTSLLGGTGCRGFADPIYKILQFLERLFIQHVINPTSFRPISDQAGLLEDL